MRRKTVLRALPWIIGLGVLLWVLRAVSPTEVWAVLSRLTWWEIGALAIINLAVIASFTARWWLLLRGQGYAIPFLRLTGYRLAVFGLSYFTPGPHVGGEPLQVLLVEKEEGVPRTTAVAAVTLDKSIEFAVNILLLLAGIALVLRWRFIDDQLGWQALGAGTALLMVPLFYLGATAAGRRPLASVAGVLPRWPGLGRWAEPLERAAAGLAGSESEVTRFMRRAPGTLLLAILISVGSWLGLVFEFWLMAAFLGVQLTFPELITALTAARIAILLFLPAGLGVLEASQALAFGALGLDPAAGAGLSLLIRARDSILGGFGLWWGSHRLKNWPDRAALTSEVQSAEDDLGRKNSGHI